MDGHDDRRDADAKLLPSVRLQVDRKDPVDMSSDDDDGAKALARDASTNATTSASSIKSAHYGSSPSSAGRLSPNMPATNSSSSSSSSQRPSHSRSRSVNLSPTLQPGATFSPGALKWDPYGHEAIRAAIAGGGSSATTSPSLLVSSPVMPSSSSHAAAPSFSAASHPHQPTNHTASSAIAVPGSAAALSRSSGLRPTSPIYVNVPGVAGASITDALGRSPLYLGSSSSSSSSGSSSSNGSDAGTSPETRRPSHLIARAMEKSSSTGSYGPHSPRSPRNDVARRTASPSRAYAIPISPRLQALGGSSPHVHQQHGRRLSGGGINGLFGVTNDPIVRIPSPLMGGSSASGRGRSSSPPSSYGAPRSPHSATAALRQMPSSPQRLNPDPELPIDSVWPSSSQPEHQLPVAANGADAIPIGIDDTPQMHIPPSLRDEIMQSQSPNGNHVANIAISGPPSSPSRRSSSPLVEWTMQPARMQRTPSPSNFSFGRRNTSQTPPPHSHSSPFLAPSSPAASSSPTSTFLFAAPQPIARNSLNLANAAMRRHSRALSSSSTDSDGDSREGPLGVSRAAVDHSPTYKAVSQPRALQAELDPMNAHAQVSQSSSSSLALTSQDGDARPEEDMASRRRRQHDRMRSEGNSSSESEDGDGEEFVNISLGNRPLASQAPPFAPPRLSASPQYERSRLLERRASFEHAATSPVFTPRHLPGPGETLGGVPFRAHSPAAAAYIAASSPSTSPYGESPPKTRSFIGMPPRSGYELSDDPDDVGSEDGSVGSGRDSVGTNEDREDDYDGDDIQLDEDEESSEGDAAKSAYEHQQRGAIGSDGDGGRGATFVRRPDQHSGSVVAPMPSRSTVSRYWGHDDEESGRQAEEGADGQNAAADDEIDADGNDASLQEQWRQHDVVSDGEAESADQDEGDAGMDEPLQEENLTMLERIFLFAKSEMTYHRTLVSHSLADWILDVELSEAVEFVIPLLNGLACDVNEVCIAFAPQLHRVMWYFFRNCPLASIEGKDKQSDETGAGAADAEVQENGADDAEHAMRPRLSVSIFTPLLCTLLLNSNATIANATQNSIVYFFARLQGFALAGDTFESDEDEMRLQESTSAPGTRTQERVAFDPNTTLIRDAAAREDKRVALDPYDFGDEPRRAIAAELLHHVGLSIGHLGSNGEAGGAEHDHDVTLTSDKLRRGNDTVMQSDVGDETLDLEEHADTIDESEKTRVPATEENASVLERRSPQAKSTDVDVEEATTGYPNGAHGDGDGDGDMTLDHATGATDDEEDMMAWNGQRMEDGIGGDTAMTSVDGMSVTMSLEDEVAVGRMASISLLAALGAEGLVSREDLLDRIVPELLVCSEDRTFFVRKEAAVALGALARNIGAEHILERGLLAALVRLARDQVWHVRQAACLSTPSLVANIVDTTLRRTTLLDVMSTFVGDLNRNVRVAALDIIGEVIYLFHNSPDGVPPQLLRHFLGLPWDDEPPDEPRREEQTSANATAADTRSSDMDYDDVKSQPPWPASGDTFFSSSASSSSREPSGWSSTDAYENGFMRHSSNTFAMDPDRPLVMAYNMPAVALTLGADQWNVLREVHADLCNNASSKVRRSLAASLHELAKIIGEEAASRDLVQFVSHFLDPRFEQDGDVKMALLDNIDVLLAHVSVERGFEVLRVLQDLWNDGDADGMGARFPSHWRMRHKLISKLPALATRYLLVDDQGILVMLMHSAIVDEVSTVRHEGIATVGHLYHLFADHDQVLADGFLGVLVDVSDHQSDEAAAGNGGYRARVATLQCLQQLCKSHIQRASIEMLAMPRLVQLSKDEIVDVRLALAALVTLMCQMDELYALPQSRSDSLLLILRRLAHDESSLVRQTIEMAVPSDVRAALGAPSPTTAQRAPRELTLGPASGGPHKPSQSSSMATGGLSASSDGGGQPFAMDDDDEEYQGNGSESNDDSKVGQWNGNVRVNANANVDPNDAPIAHRVPAPSLANSTLARRRSSSNTSLSAIRENGHAWSAGESENGGGDHEMIELPSEDNSLLLTYQEPNGVVTGREADAQDDDEIDEAPHHLMNVSDKAALAINTDHRAPELDQSAHQFALESPERPFQASGRQQQEQTRQADDVADAASLAAPDEAKAKDPFLAFVAGQHFEPTADAPKAAPPQTLNKVAIMPVQQQRSTFDDDDDDEDEEEVSVSASMPEAEEPRSS